jgi:hypothetical protein
MKLNQISAKVSESELEAIIKEAVKAKTGLEVASVSFDIGTRCTGYGMNERDETYFGGATVTFKSGQDIAAGKLA